MQSAVVLTQMANPMDRLYDDLMMEASMMDDGDLVETVQIVSVRFRVKKQVNFGEVLRMAGIVLSTHSSAPCHTVPYRRCHTSILCYEYTIIL